MHVDIYKRSPKLLLYVRVFEISLRLHLFPSNLIQFVLAQTVLQLTVLREQTAGEKAIRDLLKCISYLKSNINSPF